MKSLEIINYAIKSLRHRELRSYLTIIGIIIGIGAVVALLSIGQGFSDEVNKQLSSFGSNTIFVAPVSESQTSNLAFTSPGSITTSGKLFEKDAERLKKIGEIDTISKVVSGRGSIGFKEKQITSTVQGIEPGIFEKITTIEIENGRFLVETDQRVVVIGSSIADGSFDRNIIGVNSFITINGKKFRVVGVLKKTGGGFGPSSQLDTSILVPFKEAQNLFKENLAENEVGSLAISVKDGTNIDDVSDQITLEIASSHKLRVEDKDFSVINPKTIQERIGSIIGLVTMFLGAVAAISLIVGAIGIANTMFTSVLERTKEIGVLKSIGATNDNVLQIFVFESTLLGALGGLVGSVLGLIVVYLLSFFAVPVSIKFEIVVFGTIFSALVGFVSGFIPARNAARLSPVDALRYE
ncbi:MAG: ABC transporter permease [Candidatus Micrarchaeota archaeon]